MLMMFERIVNVVGVQLDRGWLRWTTGLYREVHQVGWLNSALRSTRTTTRAAALPAGSVAGPEELVVVQLVAAGPGVALVLRHRVRHRLVHVHVHLGAQYGHVVTWQANTGQY